MTTRIRWSFERLESMFKDQKANNLSDEAVFKKHGGKGNIWQFQTLRKRYEREAAAKVDPSETEILDLAMRITDVLKEKNRIIKELETKLISAGNRPQANQELIDKLLSDVNLRAHLAKEIMKKVN